jgi:hypothetical protein
VYVREKHDEAGETWVIRRFISCILHKILLGGMKSRKIGLSRHARYTGKFRNVCNMYWFGKAKWEEIS